jgi:hypothetical protein
MLQKALNFFRLHGSRLFKDEDTRFIMSVGLKVTGISLAISLWVYYFLYQVTRLNLAFFKAKGFQDTHDNAVYYEFIMNEAFESLPVFFAFHVFLFFIGTYVGWLMLRPFRSMGEYCERVIPNADEPFLVDEFSTYRLLTRYSEFFFEFLRDSRKTGHIKAHDIPPQYSRIHKPVNDRVFMLHFSILLIIIAICSSLFIIENASIVFKSMVELGLETLKNQVGLDKYFSEQSYILDEIFNMTIVLIGVGYTMLGFHLYNKVAGAAFGIFSTMRAFTKGNHSSRVHLVGYAYVREYTRKLNKYLDFIQKNLTKH